MIPPEHEYTLIKMSVNNSLLVNPLFFDDGEQRFTFHSLFLF